MFIFVDEKKAISVDAISSIEWANVGLAIKMINGDHYGIRDLSSFIEQIEAMIPSDEIDSMRVSNRYAKLYDLLCVLQNLAQKIKHAVANCGD